MAFRSNFFGSITHRGGRDTRVPVRRHCTANLCGTTRAGCPRSSPSPLHGNMLGYRLLFI
ncbi:MAG: hypothetical protein LBQ66_07075 [Planctomycetaceae bacterium]|nr:hypothetical protein [Planctomycetaceae bacterium]